MEKASIIQPTKEELLKAEESCYDCNNSNYFFSVFHNTSPPKRELFNIKPISMNIDIYVFKARNRLQVTLSFLSCDPPKMQRDPALFEQLLQEPTLSRQRQGIAVKPFQYDNVSDGVPVASGQKKASSVFLWTNKTASITRSFNNE